MQTKRIQQLSIRIAVVTSGVLLMACSQAPFEGQPIGGTTPFGETPLPGAFPHPRASEFIGLELFEAMEKAESLGLTWRIVERDGQKMGIFGEQQPERLNFTVKGTLITGVTGG